MTMSPEPCPAAHRYFPPVARYHAAYPLEQTAAAAQPNPP
jgi:hypothetical protein